MAADRMSAGSEWRSCCRHWPTGVGFDVFLAAAASAVAGAP
jgi:hypothetical protein